MDTEILTIQMRYNQWVLEANSAGLTHDESVRKLEPGGNSFNWILGHIMASRNGILRILGPEPIWPAMLETLYKRGSKNITSLDRAHPLADILSDLKSSHDSILSALQDIAPEALKASAPASPSGDPGETVATLLAMLVFHESYHAGQTGIVRRLLGKEGAIP